MRRAPIELLEEDIDDLPAAIPPAELGFPSHAAHRRRERDDGADAGDDDLRFRSLYENPEALLALRSRHAAGRRAA